MCRCSGAREKAIYLGRLGRLMTVLKAWKVGSDGGWWGGVDGSKGRGLGT